jgi:uroporphyrinogen-III synthase
MARLEGQNAELSKKIETRTLVERAKGILQADLRITEQEAYQKLQRKSQQMRRSMKQIAEAVVLGHALRSQGQA